MLTKKIEDILNLQIEREGYSSNLYLAMASWAEVNGFEGISQWLYAQSEEERVHMLKIIKYVNERNGHAIVREMKQPPIQQKSIKKMFEDVLKHEQFISESINNIVAACLEEKDFTTHNFIQWFVNEQIEEESSVQAIIDKLNLVGENNMYIFDRDIISMRGTAATESEE